MIPDHPLPPDLADLNPSDVARMVGVEYMPQSLGPVPVDSWVARNLPHDPFDMRGAA